MVTLSSKVKGLQSMSVSFSRRNVVFYNVFSYGFRTDDEIVVILQLCQPRLKYTDCVGRYVHLDAALDGPVLSHPS